MKQITERLTFANVMSAIAVFLVLGGTAFAAAQLGKNTVGTKQLKKNAVTKAKIKKGAVSGDKLAAGAVTDAKIKDGAVTGAKLGDNSVSTAKIQNGAVNGDKVADGSLTGADINSSSTSFSQIIARIRNPGPINMQASGPTLIGSYTQPAGEDDIYLGGLDVTFQATCTQPRSAQAFLLLDPVNPFALSVPEIAGLATTSDSNPGTVTRHMEFVEFAGTAGMKRMGSAASQGHTFYVYASSGSCSGGTTGITGSNLGVDVLGTK